MTSLEYEEVAKRKAAEMGLTLEDIDGVLDAICPPQSNGSLSLRGFLA